MYVYAGLDIHMRPPGILVIVDIRIQAAGGLEETERVI
jgi:hypothetical protein